MNRSYGRTALSTFAVAAVVAGSLLASIVTVAASGPTITGIRPASGPVGTAVVIRGTGFTGATAVDFGTVAATVTSATATTVDTSVPSGASRASVTVVTPGGNSTNPWYFKVTPSLTEVSPASGSIGATVTITGSALTGPTQVSFNGTAATVTSATYGQVVATVPSGATTGPITVTTRWGSVTSGSNFTVGGGGQVFNVTSYGAVGDGTGDNTAAFAATIAAAQAAGGGNTVYVPAGTYMFSTGDPASIQIDGTASVIFSGAGQTTTKLVEMTRRRDLLSIKANGTVVEDLTLDTQTYDGGHGVGDGANSTTLQDLTVLDGTYTFGIYFPGPPGAPGNLNIRSTYNTVNDVILNDEYKGDGFSFSFQDYGTVSNITHTGSHITLYGDENVTVTNYNYTPGDYGATAGFIISTPCSNITITDFTTSGEGGWIRTSPTPARVCTNITINGEDMTGGPSERLLIGDVKNLLVENSTLDGIKIQPNIIAQGTVTSSTYTSVTVHTQGQGVDDITFS